MDNEIEKLKQERDAAIEAGLKLANLAAYANSSRADLINLGGLVKRDLEALKPKPERRRVWARYRDGRFISSYSARSHAEQCPFDCETVPMIEVRPLPEPPELEEWETASLDRDIVLSSGQGVGIASNSADAECFCSAHNATIAKCREWMEQVRKEIEG